MIEGVGAVGFHGTGGGWEEVPDLGKINGSSEMGSDEEVRAFQTEQRKVVAEKEVKVNCRRGGEEYVEDGKSEISFSM